MSLVAVLVENTKKSKRIIIIYDHTIAVKNSESWIARSTIAKAVCSKNSFNNKKSTAICFLILILQKNLILVPSIFFLLNFSLLCFKFSDHNFVREADVSKIPVWIPLIKIIIFLFTVHAFHQKEEDLEEDGNDKLIKSRLCRALACLGIKPSVFQILVIEKRVDEIEELLKNAMIQMNVEIQER